MMRIRWQDMALAICGSMLVGCTPAAGNHPAPAPPPPPPPTQSPSPSPTASPTPSQEELTRKAQVAYQVALEEFERLSREGGADQPSAKMLEVEEGRYLALDMALLRDQKERRYKVEGPPPPVKSRPMTSASKSGSDPRLTLQVCEDRRASYSTFANGVREQNVLAQGFAYGKLVDGRVKLIDADTDWVERCDW